MRFPLLVEERFVVVLSIVTVVLANTLTGLITCRRLRAFIIIKLIYYYSHKEIYVYTHVLPEGFSAVLASSIIGQSGLWHGLTTNK